MSISPLSSQISAGSEPTEPKIGGRDVKNDHDRDDVAGAASVRALSTTNATGQPIGTVVNKSA